jgi:hypothetical protein
MKKRKKRGKAAISPPGANYSSPASSGGLRAANGEPVRTRTLRPGRSGSREFPSRRITCRHCSRTPAGPTQPPARGSAIGRWSAPATPHRTLLRAAALTCISNGPEREREGRHSIRLPQHQAMSLGGQIPWGPLLASCHPQSPCDPL